MCLVLLLLLLLLPLLELANLTWLSFLTPSVIILIHQFIIINITAAECPFIILFAPLTFPRTPTLPPLLPSTPAPPTPHNANTAWGQQ
jgi:hypothetical protein